MERNASEWSEFLNQYASQHEAAHILQTPAWGELKTAFGWDVVRISVDGVGVQVLFRRLVRRLGNTSPTIAYIPKGPVGADWEKLVPELDALCRNRHAICVKLEPDLWEDQAPSEKMLKELGLRPSVHTIQPPRTVVVDISGEEEHILAAMNQKTRYNVRLAQKKGVTVRVCSDVKVWQALMEVTGQRDGFGVHSLDYYGRVYDLFHSDAVHAEKPICEILLAEHDGIPLAALMVFAYGRRSYYLYGASNDEHRNLMPTYLIQWEAIRWSKARGCTEYDLWGIPDEDESTLEAQFTERHDGLWGVYRFKRGFGGKVLRAAGPWDRVYNPALYAAYQWWVQRQTQDAMGG
jgi:lipid II:glycine glycyltransferase (peptidoglycan interpeptide bridge formation enzyme)